MRVLIKAGRRVGFTIIEILIAIVVLVLGITGIVALFPTAIDAGNKTVEDTYAATITQSVVDAIAVGLRESRYTWRSGPGGGEDRVWTYFVFNHDGVVDPPPGEPEDFEEGRASTANGTVKDNIWQRDYCVILPQSKSNPDTNTKSADEPFFVYPVPAIEESTTPHLSIDQRHPNKLRSPSTLIDNFDLDKFGAVTADGTRELWLPDVYQLGRYRGSYGDLPAGVVAGEIRMEYRGGDLAAVSGGGTMTKDGSTVESIALDPYPTYSFCFAIKRARVDTRGPGGAATPDGVVDANDPFSNSLYELRVMIFKNFDEDEAKTIVPGSGTTGEGDVLPRTHVPIRTFITLISI